jgi:hypothetical protein
MSYTTEEIRRACESEMFCHDMAYAVCAERDEQSAALAELRAKLAKSIDAERLRNWLDDPHRKPPHLAFSAGPEREIADRITTMIDVHCEAVTKLDDPTAELVAKAMEAITLMHNLEDDLREYKDGDAVIFQHSADYVDRLKSAADSLAAAIAKVQG